MHVSLLVIFAENQTMSVVEKMRTMSPMMEKLTEEATSHVGYFSCLKVISHGQLKLASL